MPDRVTTTTTATRRIAFPRGRWIRFSFECDARTRATLTRLHHRLSYVCGLSAVRVLAALAGLIGLVLLRCPTVLTRASFWGEDGWVWYPSCYIHGWRCLLIDHTGYLQTISMLVALLAQPFPLYAAPTIFALAALIVQAAPGAFLMSWRMAEAIPSGWVRFLLAILLVVVPGMTEVYVNLTNAQWHLALLALLVLTATVPTSKAGRLFDTAILALSGLSGPFAVFLAPVGWLWWFGHRNRWSFWRACMISAAALIQLSLILLHGATRNPGGPGLGVSLRDFESIILNTILVGTIGWHSLLRNGWGPGFGWLYGDNAAALGLSTLILLAAFTLAVLACRRSRPVLPAFLLFVALECVATLIDGLPANREPLWHEIATSLTSRYSFHPILAWIAVLVALAGDRSLGLRSLGRVGLATVLLFAVPGDFLLQPLPPLGFPQEARAFEQARPGTVMRFPTRPFLYMQLTRH